MAGLAAARIAVRTVKHSMARIAGPVKTGAGVMIAVPVYHAEEYRIDAMTTASIGTEPRSSAEMHFAGIRAMAQR